MNGVPGYTYNINQDNPAPGTAATEMKQVIEE